MRGVCDIIRHQVMLNVYNLTPLNKYLRRIGMAVYHSAIENVLPHSMVFKVKMTCPKDFVVKPNCGILGPGESARVVIAVPAAVFAQHVAAVPRRAKKLLLAVPVPAARATVAACADPAARRAIVKEIFDAASPADRTHQLKFECAMADDECLV